MYSNSRKLDKLRTIFQTIKDTDPLYNISLDQIQDPLLSNTLLRTVQILDRCNIFSVLKYVQEIDVFYLGTHGETGRAIVAGEISLETGRFLYLVDIYKTSSPSTSQVKSYTCLRTSTSYDLEEYKNMLRFGLGEVCDGAGQRLWNFLSKYIFVRIGYVEYLNITFLNKCRNILGRVGLDVSDILKMLGLEDEETSLVLEFESVRSSLSS